MKFTTSVLVVLGLAALGAQQAAPQQPPAPAPTGYKDTPKQPDGKWKIIEDISNADTPATEVGVTK